MSLIGQTQKLAPEKRLAQIIAYQGAMEAERELSRYEPEIVLPLIVGFCAYFALVALFYIANQHFSGLWPLFTIPVWNFLGWRTNKKRAALQRLELLATLLLERVKLAPRGELGTLLDLAPHAWGSAILLIPMRDRLASLLPRTPTDELSRLTPMQRTALQFVTRKAIDEARYNDFFEPLAVAGLLALGSLRDFSLGGQAWEATRLHTREHIRMAAEEYLCQIAN